MDNNHKQGYTVFGALGDFPVGHRRYFLQKALARGAAELLA